MSAKLKEALEEADTVLSALGYDATTPIRTQIKQALAEPLRNCDVFATEPEMKAAFIEYYNEVWGLKGTDDAIDYCDLKHNIDGILHCYIDWLLAPVRTVIKGE